MMMMMMMILRRCCVIIIIDWKYIMLFYFIFCELCVFLFDSPIWTLNLNMDGRSRAMGWGVTLACKYCCCLHVLTRRQILKLEKVMSIGLNCFRPLQILVNIFWFSTFWIGNSWSFVPPGFLSALGHVLWAVTILDAKLKTYNVCAWKDVCFVTNTTACNFRIME